MASSSPNCEAPKGTSSSGGDGGLGAAAAVPVPILEIGELEGTLGDATLSAAFRKFLRGVDGKEKAAPEVKGEEENKSFLTLAAAWLRFFMYFNTC